jgi:hypothetical protein
MRQWVENIGCDLANQGVSIFYHLPRNIHWDNSDFMKLFGPSLIVLLSSVFFKIIYSKKHLTFLAG